MNELCLAYIRENFNEIVETFDLQSETIKENKRRYPVIMNILEQVGLNENTLVNAKKHWVSLGLKPNTQVKYMICLRYVLQHCHKAGFLKEPLHNDPPKIRIPKGHIKTGMTSEEVKQIFEYLKKINDPKKTLVIYLLFFQGFRQASLTQIKVEDINFAEGCVNIREKQHDGYKKHYLNPKTLAAFSDHLKAAKIKTGYVFPWGNSHITMGEMRRLAGAIIKSAGIKKSAHCLRHAFITNAINIVGVAKAAQLANITFGTCQIYYDDVATEVSSTLVMKQLNKEFDV